ncbi:MAG: hypothetical protein ACOCRO_03420 [Halanaerobiales bacterium]
MEHLAYCDAKAKELSNLLSKKKSMLIRGAAGRKLPYGRVEKGEKIYLIENNGDGLIKAMGIASKVYNSDKLTREESAELIEENQKKLQLTPSQKKRWSGKRYLCLIEFKNVVEIEPFRYKREKNMDDWIIVESIEDIRLEN